MSFLLDPPLLYATGLGYARAAGEGAKPVGGGRDAAFAAGTLALYLGVSVGLYRERRWTRPLSWACRARGGRDWMLNSGVFGFDESRTGRGTDALATALFATYPLWLWLGLRDGAGSRGDRG